MKNIFDLSQDDLAQFIENQGEPSFRVKQVWNGLYRQLHHDWQEFTTLPAELREKLEKQFSLNNLNRMEIRQSTKGTSRKFLFQLNDGHLIESVMLTSNNRNTLCISSQVGCPVGCEFCATGNVGFRRDLSTGEIVEQVINYNRFASANGQSVNNIVFMGMGEPLLNYEHTVAALRNLNHHEGLNIGARRMTVSTIGIIHRIFDFARENLQVNLAVSLHASNDKLRERLIPIAKKYPLQELIDACQYYFHQTNRRITFEYVLIDTVNDSIKNANELAELIKHMTCHVNLIALNPNSHFPGKPSNDDQIRKFGEVLISQGIPTSRRNSLGSDIHAGCGQLAGQQYFN